MSNEGSGRSAAVTAVCFILGIVLGVVGLALELPWWAVALAIFALVFAGALALRDRT